MFSYKPMLYGMIISIYMTILYKLKNSIIPASSRRTTSFSRNQSMKLLRVMLINFRPFPSPSSSFPIEIFFNLGKVFSIEGMLTSWQVILVLSLLSVNVPLLTARIWRISGNSRNSQIRENTQSSMFASKYKCSTRCSVTLRLYRDVWKSLWFMNRLQSRAQGTKVREVVQKKSVLKWRKVNKK